MSPPLWYLRLLFQFWTCLGYDAKLSVCSRLWSFECICCLIAPEGAEAVYSCFCCMNFLWLWWCLMSKCVQTLLIGRNMVMRSRLLLLVASSFVVAMSHTQWPCPLCGGLPPDGHTRLRDHQEPPDRTVAL